jgi:hypothetical protein
MLARIFRSIRPRIADAESTLHLFPRSPVIDITDVDFDFAGYFITLIIFRAFANEAAVSITSISTHDI